MKIKFRLFFYFLIPLFIPALVFSQKKLGSDFAIIAYYPGNAGGIDVYQVENLTHIIYSFCHLRGNELHVDNAEDSLTILKLVSLKKRNPKLKVLLSLGGWGGCKSCSEVFNSAKGRREFAHSVKSLAQLYKTDGIDLDWEYPAIAGYPGHQYLPEDRQNFTSLIFELRKSLGKKQIISFAAGGFTKFFDESIEWRIVMPKLDMVNLMTYDLFHGGSTSTGHHTALFSTTGQTESVDFAVRYLDSIGVPKNKILIGAAFYGRVWENVEPENWGLYQTGKFKQGVAFKGLNQYLAENETYVEHWDPMAQAPYWYNEKLKLFLTLDNRQSVRLKTRYAIENGLGGIMFWHLGDDLEKDGLLQVIYEESKK